MDDTNTSAIMSEFQRFPRGNRQKPNNRLLDGMSGSPVRKLESLSRSELLDLRDRNDKMLQNTGLVNTLPDKGAKLKTSIAHIDALLQKQQQKQQQDDTEAAAASSSKSTTQPAPIDDQASTSRSSRALLAESSTGNSKTRMMNMDESVHLQNEQRQAIKDEKLRRQMESLQPPKPNFTESLADDLSLSMERMKLNPETGSHRPADDDRDEYESDSEDEDSVDQAIYDSLYDDDEGFDEEYDYRH